MNDILLLEDIQKDMIHLCGGKAINLAILSRLHRIPETVVVSADLYRAFITETGIDSYLQFELQKRPLDKMRWEELWDLSLQIKNRFVKTPFPEGLQQRIIKSIPARFTDTLLAIRSSSPIEDSSTGSFAGLHESYLAIKGVDAILEHIKLVWASLFSESALMYRTELSLEHINAVSMAVILQEMILSDVSGVVFSQSPVEETEMVIEAVRGLNQGLVDDKITPDRWNIERSSGNILSTEQGDAKTMITHIEGRITERAVSPQDSREPVLSSVEVQDIIALAQKIESHFDAPQDIEWTIQNGEIILLQCRPITTLSEDFADAPLWEQSDKRPWYKTLTRSFENLKELHKRVEQEIIPGMEKDAAEMECCDVQVLNKEELFQEIVRRKEIYTHWHTVYWEELIPFAHGSRLFGEYYTKIIKPDDPFEFLKLLQKTPLISMRRNDELHQLAVMVAQNRHLKVALTTGAPLNTFTSFNNAISHFIDKYKDLTFQSKRLFQNRDELLKLIVSLAEKERVEQRESSASMDDLERTYFATIPLQEVNFAREMLELGRASYLFRDNDNIILSQVESQLLNAVHEGAIRLSDTQKNGYDHLTADEVLFLMQEEGSILERTIQPLESDEPIEKRGIHTKPQSFALEKKGFKMSARQLIGQSAGKGFAKGIARVVENTEDLFAFQAGEILICDAIDPNMTFVVPLASAIVERRGGMLVHGAIIAREYGLPCITGVANVTSLIQTGYTISVDGYLGIVTVHGN